MNADYYTADWCGPCKVFGPLLARVLSDEGIPFTKIDGTDKMPPDIMSIPTVIFYNDAGREVKTIVGAYPEPRLREVIAELKSGHS